MVSKRKGVRLRSATGIQIDFMYRGIRCRETLRLKPTKENQAYVLRMRESILHEIAKGTFRYSDHFPNSSRSRQLSERQKKTFTHAVDQYLKGSQKTCAPSTHRDYKSAVEFHLKPIFGDRFLDEITTADIKSWIGCLTISAKRINNVLVPLRAVFEDAYADGVIDRNPMDRIKNLSHRFPEPDPLSPPEIERLLEHCDGQVRNLFQFAIWTGCRTSELIALEWGDVDWSRGVIRIRRASVRKIVKAPKTQAGERDVKLMPGARESLEAQKPFSYLLGKQIFYNPRTNMPWETDQQIRMGAWAPAVRRSGIRDRNPYQTRHTFASLCLTVGEDIAWVSRQLGHTSISMTLKRYARWIEGVNTTGGDKFSLLLSQVSHRSEASA